MILPPLVLTRHETIKVTFVHPIPLSTGRYSADFPTHTPHLRFPHDPSDVSGTTLPIRLREFSKRLSQYLTNFMHKICFTVSFISCIYMFRAYVLIIRRSKLHYTASGIITPIGVMSTCARNM